MSWRNLKDAVIWEWLKIEKGFLRTTIKREVNTEWIILERKKRGGGSEGCKGV
jgi:hypothetical protein